MQHQLRPIEFKEIMSFINIVAVYIVLSESKHVNSRVYASTCKSISCHKHSLSCIPKIANFK